MNFSQHDTMLILHSINVYLEKLSFVLNNSETYNIDYLTISLLKNDYEDLLQLRKKISLIEIKDNKLMEGS